MVRGLFSRLVWKTRQFTRLAKRYVKAAFPLVTAKGTAANRNFWLHVAIHAIVAGLNWKSSDLHS